MNKESNISILDQETLMKYLRGELKQDEALRVKAVIDNDPFYKDALEGLAMIADKKEVPALITALDNEINQQTGTKSPGKIINLNLGRYFAAAASILLLVGAGWFLMKSGLFAPNTQGTLAVNEEKTERTYKSADDADTETLAKAKPAVIVEKTEANRGNYISTESEEPVVERVNRRYENDAQQNNGGSTPGMANTGITGSFAGTPNTEETKASQPASPPPPAVIAEVEEEAEVSPSLADAIAESEEIAMEDGIGFAFAETKKAKESLEAEAAPAGYGAGEDADYNKDKGYITQLEQADTQLDEVVVASGRKAKNNKSANNSPELSSSVAQAPVNASMSNTVIDQQLLYNGKAAYDNAQYGTAIASFDSYLAAAPGNRKALFYRGSSHCNQGSFQKAIKDYDVLLKNSGTYFTSTQWMRAMALIRKGDKRKARKQLEEIIQGGGKYAADAEKELGRMGR